MQNILFPPPLPVYYLSLHSSFSYAKIRICMTKVISYFSGVWQELGKVTWPTRQETIKMTLTVVIASAIIGVLIGGLDLFLTDLIGKLLNL